MSRRAIAALLTTPLVLASVACDHDHDGDHGQPAVVTGTVERSSFPRQPRQLTVEAVGASRHTIDLESDGSFQVALAAGGTYRLLLSPGGDRWPLTLRSGIGRLDTTVFVATGGASANVGRVRFWPGGTEGRAAIVGTEPATCSGGELPSGEPCAVGEATISCPSKGHGNGRGSKRGRHGDHHDDDGDDDRREEAACHDGIDADGQECNGGPTAFDASAFEAQAIPTTNLPDVLACAEHDDDDDDD